MDSNNDNDDDNNNENKLKLIQAINLISSEKKKNYDGSYNGKWNNIGAVYESGVLFYDTLPGNFNEQLWNSRLLIGDSKFIDLINGNRSKFDQIRGLRNILVNDFTQRTMGTFGGSKIRRFR